MTTTPREPRVLLMRLAQRTSAKGTTYLSGWLGKARLVGFKGEPDEHGNECWDIFTSEPTGQGPPYKKREGLAGGARGEGR